MTSLTDCRINRDMNTESYWPTAVADLERCGFTIKKISEEVGLAISSVSDLKRGASQSPRGMAAVKLHELHQRICVAPTAKAKRPAPTAKRTAKAG